MITVKEKIEAGRKLVSTDAGMWAFFLENEATNNINKQIDHMLMVNPELGTLDAVKEVVQRYLNVVLTEKDCAAVNAFRGLPQVLSAYSDKAIMESFKQSIESGKMAGNPTVMQTFKGAAYDRIAKNIIEEASSRARNENLTVEERENALMEFGLDAYEARKSVEGASGGHINVWRYAFKDDPMQGGREIPFDPYQLAGIPQQVSV